MTFSIACPLREIDEQGWHLCKVVLRQGAVAGAKALPAALPQGTSLPGTFTALRAEWSSGGELL